MLETAQAPVVAISGPTGSGKSDWVMRLIDKLGGRGPAEIVSVDSAQVYRGMDIGTAKPDARVRDRVPHHLIDIRDPAEAFSAGDFLREAERAVAAILARGALPVLVGGTLLYFRALRQGLAAMPPANAAIRAQLDAQAASEGWESLHAELARVDPAAAARISPRDAQRLQRALEIFRTSGRPLTDWHASEAVDRPRWRWMSYALLPDSREALRERLRLRLEGMLRAGLVEEVRSLYRRGDLTAQHASMRAVGYRQLWRFCAGEVPLEAAVSQAGIATAQLAKRQLTWLRGERHWTAVNAMDVGALDTAAAAISAAAFA